MFLRGGLGFRERDHVSGRGTMFLGGGPGFWEGDRVSGRGTGFLGGGPGFWEWAYVSNMFQGGDLRNYTICLGGGPNVSFTSTGIPLIPNLFCLLHRSMDWNIPRGSVAIAAQERTWAAAAVDVTTHCTHCRLVTFSQQ